MAVRVGEDAPVLVAAAFAVTWYLFVWSVGGDAVSPKAVISNSPSRFAATIPLTVPETLEMVTKSPSLAPCVASWTTTFVDVFIVVKSVMFPVPEARVGVMSYHALSAYT